MEGDPYSAFAGLFESSNGKSEKPIMRRGTVINVDPLEIDVGGIVASGDELQLNITIKEMIEAITPKIMKGDTLLLLTTDDQVFYVLCKVVGT